MGGGDYYVTPARQHGPLVCNSKLNPCDITISALIKPLVFLQGT